jgi:hypothetical protein
MTEQRGQTLAAGLLAADQDEEDEEDDQETPVAAPTPAGANKADEAGREQGPQRQRESKSGKGEQTQEPVEFASIEQILGWVRGGKMAARVDGPKAAEAQGQARADSKRSQTDRRAANSDE